MKSKKIWITLVILIMMLLVPLGKVNAASDGYLQKIKDKGTLVVGTSADYPPYEFTVKQSGKTTYVGLDIEIAKKFAKDLGVKLEIKNMNFDSLLVALETHKVDAVISGMNPTPERQKSVDFSNVYYRGKQYMLINKKDAALYKNIHSFKNKTIGAQAGSLQYDLVKKQMKNNQVKGLAKLNDLVIALESGKVNAVAMEEATAKAFAQNNTSLKVINPEFNVDSSQTGSAMAFPKGATSLVQAANKTIAQIKKKNLINKQYIPLAGKYMTNNSKKNSMWNYWTYFAKGIEYTLIITVVSVFFGFILGVLLALLRLSKSKLGKAIATAYIEFVRGTPLMVQVMFVYFGIGAVIQSLPALLAGIIAVSLNSAAYVAEVIRSGIESIPAGQTEAARSLGMSQTLTYRYVIIPQALKNIWPALGNEFITLIKESSIVSIIGVGDLMYQMQLVQSATYKGVIPIFITMVIYFVMTFGLSKVLGYFEGRMKHA
ncbi:ABC transporter substrate-binding protein/permease [Liquorilactobacillus mali]|uniref:Amino acid ABC transporter n=2 Tax=Liquorilactobacillus mali TaxID=1618 RepID=A0A0R2ECE4_9LACO|nr:ABC transporter substrate-binding protein/permease [Liquorilactobacillus mali]KRN10519.1 amino acid ABC transporter [Liquorilactobacillus mali KCTC 3596 = DSM 20444]MDC7951886.1 ABC transporter substrate-binding protein/permease [Liquorilactobacillus mali]QFQ75064.1 ABC transporter substrate-binding protein/permease [Liquorilactobacillus mali]